MTIYTLLIDHIDIDLSMLYILPNRHWIFVSVPMSCAYSRYTYPACISSLPVNEFSIFILSIIPITIPCLLFVIVI